MTAKRVRIGDVLRQDTTATAVVPGGVYENIGVLNRGRGLFRKPTLTAHTTQYRKLFPLQPRQVIYSKLFAWEGAISLVPHEYGGRFVSGEFPHFDINESIATAEYLHHVITSDRFIEQLRRSTTGMGQRRQRVNVKDFLSLEIPLPSLDEQRAIAARLDRTINESQSLQAAQGSRRGSLPFLPDLLDTIFDRAGLKKVAAVTLYQPISDVIQPDDDPGEARRFVGLEHVESHSGVRIGETEIDGRRGRKLRFRKGDVLFGYLRPYLNKVWASDGPGLCSVEQYVLRPRQGVDAALLSAALRTRGSLGQATAATHHLQLPRLRSALLAEIQVPNVKAAGDDLRNAITRVTETARELDRLMKAQVARANSIAAAARNEVFANL